MKSKLLKRAASVEVMDKAKELAYEHLNPFVTRFRKEIVSETHPGSEAYKLFTDVENQVYEAFKKLVDEIEMMKAEVGKVPNEK